MFLKARHSARVQAGIWLNLTCPPKGGLYNSLARHGRKFLWTFRPAQGRAGKVTGRARYIDDISFPDMLHGVTVRSSGARGRIRGIRFGDGIPWNEFTIVTAADIPGQK